MYGIVGRAQEPGGRTGFKQTNESLITIISQEDSDRTWSFKLAPIDTVTERTGPLLERKHIAFVYPLGTIWGEIWTVL